MKKISLLLLKMSVRRLKRYEQGPLEEVLSKEDMDPVGCVLLRHYENKSEEYSSDERSYDSESSDEGFLISMLDEGSVSVKRTVCIDPVHVGMKLCGKPITTKRSVLEIDSPTMLMGGTPTFDSIEYFDDTRSPISLRVFDASSRSNISKCSVETDDFNENKMIVVKKR